MNPSKRDDLDHIQFLIAAQKAFTCTEAARSQPQGLKDPPAHDSLTRLLTRKPPDTKALWEEAQTLVEPDRGVLVMDDTTLDKNPTLARWSWSTDTGAASIDEWFRA